MLQRAGLTTSVTRKSVLLCLCICGAVLLTARVLPARAAACIPASTSSSAAGTTPTLANIVTTARKGLCGQILLPLDARGKLAEVLESEKAKVGVELGVQNGNFAETILRQWRHNIKYHLVDIWAPLENYLDAANVDAAEQDRIYQQAQLSLEPYKNQTVFLKMTTTEAAKHIDDDSVDFVYIDARHDYCGVTQDLQAYWPKLKGGGILAGHDFVTNHELQSLSPDQDWSVCEDGTRNEGAVNGAVTDFAKKHNLQLSITYREDFPTWYARKPC